MKIQRSWVDDRLDDVRFRLDKFPSLDYQPLPWLGIDNAPRATGAASRWKAISKVVDELEPSNAIDVGANVGYYSISLALRGIPVLSIEPEPKFFRTLNYAVRRLGLDHVGCLSLDVNPRTVGLVPETDCMLFLAVWHHMMRVNGFEQATSILCALWKRTKKVMFFETGESEMPESFPLPPEMRDDPAAFLEDFLGRVCEAGRVVSLGSHQAFDPAGNTSYRHLFSIIRMSQTNQ